MKCQKKLETYDNPVLERARQIVLSRTESKGVTYDGCEAGIVLADNGIEVGRGRKSMLNMGGGSILMTG
jgi:hypothetical protein